MHRGPKVHTVRDRASVLNAEKSRKREYTILRRERKKTMRNDIDVEENVSTEHQPTQEKDPIGVASVSPREVKCVFTLQYLHWIIILCIYHCFLSAKSFCMFT